MQDNALIEIGLPISLFIIMVGMGLSLTANDFKRVVEQPRAIALGTVVQLLLIPAAGFAVAFGFASGIMAAGIVLVAALPGGTTSNLISYLGRANLALSITLTVIASLATVLTLPLYVNLALQAFTGDGADIQLPFLKTLVTMLVILIVPVLIGMVINHFWPEPAKRAESMIGVFSAVVLLAIIVGILVAEWNNIGGWLEKAWLPVLALNVVAMVIALGVAELGKLTLTDGITIAIEGGIKNTTIGLMIALTIIENTELAIPAAIYGLLMYASALVIAVSHRRMIKSKQTA